MQPTLNTTVSHSFAAAAPLQQQQARLYGDKSPNEKAKKDKQKKDKEAKDKKEKDDRAKKQKEESDKASGGSSKKK